MSFCYKKILGVFTHLRVTTPNIIEPKKLETINVSSFLFYQLPEAPPPPNEPPPNEPPLLLPELL